MADWARRGRANHRQGGRAGHHLPRLAVQARTLEFYRQVGVADALVAGGVKVAGLNLWAKGERAARVPIQELGQGLSPYPFPLIHPQDAHERLLIDHLGAQFIDHAAAKENARLMPKPTVIDIPYPTLAEVARTYGISPTRRRQLERQLDELMIGNAANRGRSRGRSAAKAARRTRKK